MRKPLLILLLSTSLIAQSAPESNPRSSGPAKGTLIVDGGGASDPVKERFLTLAGGKSARIVVIPTGASAMKFGAENTILNPDWPREHRECIGVSTKACNLGSWDIWAAYERWLKQWFGVEQVTVLHTRDRAVADSESFVKPLESATGVFIGSGNAGRLASAYLGTRTQKELEALLNRGGLIFGSSAGAIILGSFIVRGWTEKPILMAPGRDRGFGFMKNVAIDPHFTSAKRDYELINVCDAHPEILGIGIDEDAALVVTGNRFELIGTGKAAIYDNQPHPGGWYYYLNPGEKFDLGKWEKVGQ